MSAEPQRLQIGAVAPVSPDEAADAVFMVRSRDEERPSHEDGTLSKQIDKWGQVHLIFAWKNAAVEITTVF